MGEGNKEQEEKSTQDDNEESSSDDSFEIIGHQQEMTTTQTTGDGNKQEANQVSLGLSTTTTTTVTTAPTTTTTTTTHTDRDGDSSDDEEDGGSSSDSSCRPISPSPAPVKPSAMEQAADELAQWAAMVRTIAEVAETKRGADYLSEALALYSYALDVAKNALVYASRQLTLQQTALGDAGLRVREGVGVLRQAAASCASAADEVQARVPDSAFCSPPEVLLYEQALYFARRGASLEMMVAVGADAPDALLYYRKANAIFDALNRFTSDAEDKARLTTCLFLTLLFVVACSSRLLLRDDEKVVKMTRARMGAVQAGAKNSNAKGTSK